MILRRDFEGHHIYDKMSRLSVFGHLKERFPPGIIYADCKNTQLTLSNCISECVLLLRREGRKHDSTEFSKMTLIVPYRDQRTECFVERQLSAFWNSKLRNLQ